MNGMPGAAPLPQDMPPPDMMASAQPPMDQGMMAGVQPMASPAIDQYPSTNADQLAMVLQQALDQAFGADHQQLEADQQAALPQAMQMIHPYAQALMAGPPQDQMRGFGEGVGPAPIAPGDLGMGVA